MKYAVLIYSKEVPQDQVTPQQWQDTMNEYNAYTALLNEKGVNANSGEALQDTNTAKSIRIQNGKRQVTDGPFAETREQLGGYFLIDVENLDIAIDIAGRIPAGRWGTVEIRPVVEVPSLPTDLISRAVDFASPGSTQR